MKFDCGPTWRERRAALEVWHRHFTWWPRRVASHDCRWLEWIERKGTYDYFPPARWILWEYRAIGHSGGDCAPEPQGPGL